MRKIKTINLNNLLIYLLLYSNFIFFIEEIINFGTRVYLLIFFLLTILILKSKSKSDSFIVLISWLIMLIQFVFNNDTNKYIWIFYYTIFIYLIMYCSKEIVMNRMLYLLKINKNGILFCNLIILMTNIVYFIKPIGWVENWGTKVFNGMFTFSHETAYQLLVVIITLCILYKLYKINFIKKLIICLIIISFILLYYTNVRTILFTTLALVLLINYKNTKNKIPILILSLSFTILFLLIQSNWNIINFSEFNIVQKFLNSASSSDITNGRLIVWENLINNYLYTWNISDQVVGKGFFYTTSTINLFFVGQSLWAHNDIIEILISSGVLGLIIYIYSYFKCCINLKNTYFIIFIFIIAFWNGVFIYYRLLFGIPLIMLFSSKVFKYYKY